VFGLRLGLLQERPRFGDGLRLARRIDLGEHFSSLDARADVDSLIFEKS
jgi:hypothetical protein